MRANLKKARQAKQLTQQQMADLLHISLRQYACGWILGELEEGNTVPEASEHDKIEINDSEFVNMLLLDIDLYAEQYGEKAVRKNLTIPAWLNTFAEKNNVNFSKILQDALLSMTKAK